jgi:hypothetical protein
MTTATEITVSVKIEKITEFTRWNRWQRCYETKYAISMSEDGAEPDAPWLVTFTNSQFSREIEAGEIYTITCKHKKFQSYNGHEQAVVTHCKIV